MFGRPHILTILAVVALGASLAPGTADGPRTVEVGAQGVLISAPEAGLRNIGGPDVVLRDDFAEWFGIRYVKGGVPREAVALGNFQDWAGREPVRPVDFTASGSGATVITRAGDLEIRTDYSPDEDGPYLLVKVTLTNRGDEPLDSVVFTREWSPGKGEGWTYPGDSRDLAPAPEDVARQAWNVGELPPLFSAVHWFAYEEGDSGGGTIPDDLLLELWTNDDFPNGLPVGETNGISWGDFDADGYPDIFACQSAHLWRNVGGTTWELAADLDTVLPESERRYGASFADYDRDGWNDIGTEPRVPMSGDDRMHLLKNMGGQSWVNVAVDSAIIDVQPYGNSETLCWGDVDGDGHLDAFLPVYPPWANGPGNFFLYGEGPTGPGGAHRFTEMVEAAGLDNPIGTHRPEGAQLADLDFDGDLDLYSNGTLYRNVSVPGIPIFQPLPEIVSGIGLSGSLDEGAMFFDYDLDGDLDLFVTYTLEGILIWENRGDGTFFEADQDIVDSPFIGLNLGIAAEDWDNDGDIDFSTRGVFRRNRLIEDGLRRFTVATHSIKADHIGSAIPAWGDWDKDGDLDCAMGNSGGVGHLYENALYGPDTPDDERRYVRVRVVGDEPAVPRGVEAEYGAVVELDVTNRPDRFRRMKFVSSAHGYLNQNEYPLHFGFADDLDPLNESDPLRFDVTVDFPVAATDGLWRIDEHVNPVLGEIDLTSLEEREIDVYRCGGVAIDGEFHEPIPLASPRLRTTLAGLVGPTATEPLPPPESVPGPSWITGVAFDTLAATGPLRIKEIVFDGLLFDSGLCGETPFNVFLWDVTNPPEAFVVPGGSILARSPTGNHRTRFRTDVVVAPGRVYRLLARATWLRTTEMAGPIIEGPVKVRGGIGVAEPALCGTSSGVSSPVDPNGASIAFSFTTVPASTSLDPVGSSLRLDRDAQRNPVLDWSDVGAAGYRVLRCRADGGPCEPGVHATTTEATWTDTDHALGPGEMLWYVTKAVNECLL